MGGVVGSFIEQMAECDDTMKQLCPQATVSGYYRCKTHDACRLEEHGPFPEDTCKMVDQCRIKKEAEIKECKHHTCITWSAETLYFFCTANEQCRSETSGPFPEAICKRANQC